MLAQQLVTQNKKKRLMPTTSQFIFSFQMLFDNTIEIRAFDAARDNEELIRQQWSN